MRFQLHFLNRWASLASNRIRMTGRYIHCKVLVILNVVEVRLRGGPQVITIRMRASPFFWLIDQLVVKKMKVEADDSRDRLSIRVNQRVNQR